MQNLSSIKGYAKKNSDSYHENYSDGRFTLNSKEVHQIAILMEI